MIVTNRNTMSMGDDEYAEHESGAPPTRAYRPGSRLRQALDLARRSSTPASAPAAPVQHADTARERVYPEEPARPAEEISAATAPEPAGEPLPQQDLPSREATVARLAPTASAAPLRRKGLGRGLDALLPANGSGAGLAPETWETAAQGWIQTDDGRLEWRPIVTTVERLDLWEVATYLGIVEGRADIGTTDAEAAGLAWGRRQATKQMTADAIARGAHGVIGVHFEYLEGPTGLAVTAFGTAVTLGHRR
jgi:uncharacterized protein YbjQ (UPF0145 family)